MKRTNLSLAMSFSILFSLFFMGTPMNLSETSLTTPELKASALGSANISVEIGDVYIIIG